MLDVRIIPFFNYPALFAENEQGYMEVVGDVLKRGAYIMQKDLDEFETSLARYLSVKHAIGTADGTMALTMSLMAAGIGAGDEVILPSHTFVASAASVHHVGAKPVLADCGADHLIDTNSVQELITQRTRAIMPVQLNGRTADMDRLLSITEDYSLLMIEDACQALGSKYKNRFAGTFGVAGAFSFYPSKTLGCFGDGGAVVTNDDMIAEKVRLLRDHGRCPDGKVACFGFNARLDNLHAAILNLKLKNYDRSIARRRELAARYNTRLKDLSQIVLPPPPDGDASHFDIYQNYEIEAERRDDLRSYLKLHGIQTILQWGGRTIHQLGIPLVDVILPFTDQMSKRFLLLPMNTTLTNEDVDYICDKVLAFYSGD